ncbi:uncharacterized protein LOC141911806 isoform X2 [Tubulanus polymorphus]|uniref:uncharacterized protein LOC141911806 isoform X2 n=1 Tax=Tubulanus polymorphus TaxID=672921 RepID=UPI003DA21A63
MEYSAITTTDCDGPADTTPSISITRPATQDVTGDENIPYIDLYNLDDPKFEGCKYVLTSPRSLEACSRLGIKPAALLYKSLADFQDELEPQGIPLRTIYKRYDEIENQRQKMLRQCREQQDKIMKEDSERKLGLSDSSTAETTKRLTDESEGAEKIDEEKDIGSLQRLRTALTLAETNRPIDRSSDLRGLSFGGEERISRPRRYLTSTPMSSCRRTKSAGSVDRSLSPAKSNCPSVSLSELKFTRDTPLGRKSMENVGTISNVKLRNKLKNLKNAQVSREDEKILECLMKKHEREKSLRRRRNKANLRWDEEHELERLKQDEAENSRRENLAVRYHQWQKKRNLRKKKLDREFETTIREREKSIEQSEKHWQTLAQKQQFSKLRQIEDQRRRNDDKKKRVDKRLEDFDKELQEFQNLVLQHQQFTLKRAETKREAKEYEETEKRKSLNAEQVLQHQRKINLLEESTREKLEDLKSSVCQRHEKAEENLSALLTRKERDIVETQLEREKRLRKTQQRLKDMNDEMKQYYEEITAYREMKLGQAENVVNKSLEQKKQRVQDERSMREKIHRLNFSRVLVDDETKLEDIKSSIAMKDAKSQSILEEREIVTNQLRNKAYQSQQLREQLLGRYERDTFDKKVQKVELESTIGKGHHSGNKNVTTLRIGLLPRRDVKKQSVGTSTTSATAALATENSAVNS